MSRKKIRAIFSLLIIVLVLVLLLYYLIGLSSNKDKQVNNEKSEQERYEYSFSETINLEKEDTFENTSSKGTDYLEFGTISDFYDGTDIEYKDDKIYMETYDGERVISASWMNEGYAQYIKEPAFGVLDKFILERTSASARFNEVEMKNVTNYINELSGLGFNEVLKDEKNKKNDYYIYSAKKVDRTVTLNYENGVLLITVF